MDNMQQYLKPGIQESRKYTIKNSDLASTLKTGDIPYVATPSLIILMEQVICDFIHNKMPSEYTSVSAEINIKHLIPLAERETITCSVHLKFVEDDKLFFDFALFNEDKEIVAIGAHERFIVIKDKFPK
jgi:predicted thioesterase